MAEAYIGFDSAWADNPKAPGAICAVVMQDDRPIRFHEPRLVSFAGGLEFIREIRTANELTLVALDQPTIVPNLNSCRPVERVAGSLISWLGGGVQPSNRGRTGMFCDAAPIWNFLQSLGAVEDPEAARAAVDGLYLLEVFPALALASLDPSFFGRLCGPRYNPARRKTFRLEHWRQVAAVASHEARSIGCSDLANWCDVAGRQNAPRKALQDMLDSTLCALIALRWRLHPRGDSLLLGDLRSGYMVLPASPMVRERLAPAARKHSVPVDGTALPLTSGV